MRRNPLRITLRSEKYNDRGLKHFYEHFRLSRFYFPAFALSSYAKPRFYARILVRRCTIERSRTDCWRITVNHQPPARKSFSSFRVLRFPTNVLDSWNHYAYSRGPHLSCNDAILVKKRAPPS